MSKPDNADVAGGPHPNPPDARAPTHDQADSKRAGAQPYANESEDYRAENIVKPERSEEAKKPQRGN
jgi:hypothetical protein